MYNYSPHSYMNYCTAEENLVFNERSVKMIKGSINEIVDFRGCMLLKYAVKICIIIIFSLTRHTSPVRAEDHMNQTKQLLY